MVKRISYLILLALLLAATQAMSQSRTYRGTVYDESNDETLIGVNVSRAAPPVEREASSFACRASSLIDLHDESSHS